MHEIRLSLRNLFKNPGFAAVAVTMLALGIGVNATVFTVVDGVLFKGFPLVKDNDRLVYISNGGCCISYPDFQDIRAQARSFSGMGITHGIGRIVGDANAFPENVSVTEISAGTFPLTGQSPILGRGFEHSDEVDGAALVAILNYSFWQRRYGRDPAIIGQTIKMDGNPATVVGIMPDGYSFPQTTDVWVPLLQTARVMNRNNTDTWFAFGRLKDGVSFEQARTEVETIIRRLESDYPPSDLRRHLVVQHFYEFLIGPNVTALYGSMWGAVGFVLLIACANLANLMLARALGRSREISVRVALGAGRWRIMRGLLVESLMLSALGGFCGWWIARWGVTAYAAAMKRKSGWLIIDYAMDHRVLWYLIAISVVTGLLFGLAPALRLSQLDINTALKDGGRGATGGGRARHLSALLVSIEMALAVVLLAGAGVMIRSFWKIHSAELGVDMNGLLITSIDLPPARYASPDRKIAFFDTLTARLQSIPGMESVALAENLPTQGSTPYTYELAGVPAPPADRRPTTRGLKISPNYFRVLRGSVTEGREFTDADSATGAPVAIVNRLFASRYWPGEDPLGKRLRLATTSRQGEWLTVVGVASNIIQNDQNRRRVDPEVYLPYRQQPGAGEWIFMRTPLGLATVAPILRQDVHQMDPDLPMFGPFVLVDRLEFFLNTRFYGILFMIFAAIALLLASIGLYTVIAHSVSQRTQEIGVRMAIGARSPDILRLVLRQGLIPLGSGLIVGLAASLAVNRVLASTLVQVSPSDPIALAVASGVLIVAATLGCMIPARRAMQVDPVEALRHE